MFLGIKTVSVFSRTWSLRDLYSLVPLRIDWKYASIWRSRGKFQLRNDKTTGKKDESTFNDAYTKSISYFSKSDLLFSAEEHIEILVLITTAESFSLSAMAQLRCHGKRPFKSCRQKNQSREASREEEWNRKRESPWRHPCPWKTWTWYPGFEREPYNSRIWIDYQSPYEINKLV